MKVAKTFRWASAHRLPKHAGKCRHLHGHSYRMTVEVEGEPDESGMVIDFQDIKSAVIPLVEQWDHATLVAASDAHLLEMMRTLGDRYVTLPVETTAENLCLYVADFVCREAAFALQEHGIEVVRVRIDETDTCYASCEARVALRPGRTRSDTDAVLDRSRVGVV